MINGLEGIPRSGKSYEACVFHVLEALKDGRKVITNLPLNVEVYAAIDASYRDLIEIRTKSQPVLGTWDADRQPAFKLFEEGETAPAVGSLVLGSDGRPTLRKRAPLFGQVWDYYSEWKDKKGRGPLFVIDECHVAMPKLGTDGSVEEWYKLHGHFNQDVLLITQAFREMSQPIAGNIAILIRVRKADILGDSDSYIRKVHAGYRGAVISTDTRKYKKELFSLYRSHTQGNSVAEASATDVKPFIVKFNRFKWLWLAGTLVYGVYAFWPSAPVKPANEWTRKALAGELPRVDPAALPSASARPSGAAASAPMPPSSEPLADVDPDPFKANGLHLTGWAKLGGVVRYSFVVSGGGSRLFELTQSQIEKAGYSFEPLGDCAGLLKFRSKVKTVICDAPVLAMGSTNAPVVIADGSRKRSDSL